MGSDVLPLWWLAGLQSRFLLPLGESGCGPPFFVGCLNRASRCRLVIVSPSVSHTSCFISSSTFYQCDQFTDLSFRLTGRLGDLSGRGCSAAYRADGDCSMNRKSPQRVATEFTAHRCCIGGSFEDFTPLSFCRCELRCAWATCGRRFRASANRQRLVPVLRRAIDFGATSTLLAE